jgi:hypothetical protein
MIQPTYVPEHQTKPLENDAYEISVEPMELESAAESGAKLYVDTTTLPSSGTAAFYFAITPINDVDFVVAVPSDFIDGKVTVSLGDELQEHPA